MCGRFARKTASEEIKRRYDTVNAVECPPSYNVAPSQPIVSILYTEGQRRMALMKWGLVPSWAKDPAIGNRMINARAETIDEKPSYRSSFTNKRCIIPADGFYEWDTKTRNPYYFSPRDGLFSLAGLWDHWQGADGSELVSCTIITTGANATLKPIHERMPVILDGDALKQWLSDSQDTPLLKSLLQPYDDAKMQAWVVSKEVNSPSHNYPKVLEAVSA